MDEQSLELTRRYGTIMCAVSAVAGLLFVVGLLRRSYWAVALPVGFVTLGGLGAALAIGRLLMTTPDEPTEY
jgi:urea transporter